ncbi:zinc ribbon domain-containing protein [Virgibacillus sp. 179-BFC.A HS]|uniref:Zinc ribbon domain-containing protein n=1 Tax=Tigheibacillus jepli TaxID=3035914 RepID=A0ABU5CGD2_9BACI|nr:zinc ribbon domain-containing protein [Virgibacillus sp. 179-BFC.A HS]MDY0404605.1 zinc ribbon domain-containing protein [Virgibacillus sp. 179-BFC.A HS]
MKCSNCGYEQNEGKFCGKCGAPMPVADGASHETETTENHEKLLPEKQDTVQHANSRQESDERKEVVSENQTAHLEQQTGQKQPTYEESIASSRTSPDAIEKVKHTSKAFWTYFTHHFKRPSDIFQSGDKQFKNGLISVLLLIVLLSITAYLLMRDLYAATYYPQTWGAPDFDVPSYAAGSVFALMIILTAMVIALILITLKILGVSLNFKTIVSIFGAHTVFINVVACIALLLVLVKANSLGTIFFITAITMLITSMPLYLISNLLTKYAKTFDAYYGYLLYLIFAAIAFAIYFLVVADSIFGNILDSINRY